MIFPNGVSCMFLGQSKLEAYEGAAEVLEASDRIIEEASILTGVIVFKLESGMWLQSDAEWLSAKYPGAEHHGVALVHFLNEIARKANILLTFGDCLLDDDDPNTVLIELQ